MQMEQEISDRIKAECLGIRCFNKIDNKIASYSLIPINEWTKEICDELNNTDFEKNYNMAPEQELDSKGDEYKDKFSNLEKLNKPVNNVFLYNELLVPYVRFHNIVILQNDTDNIDDIVRQIESSIIENLGIVANFDSKKASLLEQTESITKSNYADYKESLKNLTDICALSAKYSLNKRPTNGSDNQIWYELLQNANDHIPINSCKELKIIFNDNDKTFTLEYPDKGFSVRDFLAICTEGNSGNVLSDENREGHKGTGFKSVYNLFNKVTITSGPVKCVLNDVEKNITIINENNGKISINVLEKGTKKSENYYPIPEFTYLAEGEEGKTIISFQSETNLEGIKRLIFGDVKDEENLLNKFIEKKDYLFLDNIEEISFHFNGNSSSFKRKDHIKENYIKMEYTINDGVQDGVQKDKNPNWNNRAVDLFEKKKKLTFLFSKNVQFPENASESRVYCTLPIDEFKLKVPFYVNIPLLELNDARNNLACHKMGEFNFEDWNKTVLKAGLFQGFKSIVEHETGSERQNQESSDKENVIGLSNWYKYFPYSYLKERVFGIDWSGNLQEVKFSGNLQDVKFLRTTTSTNVGEKKVKSAAISDLVQSKEDIQNEDKSIFLPCNMYEWLHDNKDDFFESKKSKDDKDREIPPVSFVYYDNDIQEEKEGDETKTVIIEDKIKEKIKEKKEALDFSQSIYFLQTAQEKVGKILLELKDYLLNEKKKKNDTIFYEWLKKLLESEEFKFRYKNVFIYQAYFKAKGVDYKKVKYHWLKKSDNDFYTKTIGGYSSINEIIKEMKNDLYGGESYNLKDEEILSIRTCFKDLIESPYTYIKYECEKNDWRPKELLRDKEDAVLPIIDAKKEIWTGHEEILEILCYYSEKLLNLNDNSNQDLKIGKVNDDNGWFKDNKVKLFVKNTNNKIIPATEKVYYVDKEKNIKSDSVVKSGEQFFVSLEAALGKEGDFFKKNENNKDNGEFVIKILEAYDVSIWTEQAQKYIENENTNKDIRSTIFRHLIKESEGPIDWNAAYSELVKDCSIDELWKDGKAAFKFIKDDVNKLSQYVLDIFENKVSIQEKEKTRIGDSMLDKSLQEIVKNDIFVFQCKTGNKSLYCKGRISEENNTQRDIYVLFGENAFGTLLRNVFRCYDFSEYKIYDEMQCNAIDALNVWKEQESEPFGDSIGKKVDDLIDKWKEGEQEEFKRALVTRFDVRNNETMRWFHARGYGNEEYINRICPVCKGILLSEMHALTVRNIICTIEEQKYYFPMLMCKNCGDAINYAETVELESSIDGDNDGNLFKVGKNSFEEYNVIFSMNGREKKKLNCKVSFLNRYIWKRIKEKEDENRQGKI